MPSLDPLDIPDFLNVRLSARKREAAWDKIKKPYEAKAKEMRKHAPPPSPPPVALPPNIRPWMVPKQALTDPKVMEAIQQREKEKEVRKKERLEEFKSTRAPRELSPKKEIRARLIDIKTVAAEFGIEPRIARQYLRKAKFPKPVWGWAFNEDQIKRSRELISVTIREQQRNVPKRSQTKDPGKEIGKSRKVSVGKGKISGKQKRP